MSRFLDIMKKQENVTQNKSDDLDNRFLIDKNNKTAIMNMLSLIKTGHNE